MSSNELKDRLQDMLVQSIDLQNQWFRCKENELDRKNVEIKRLKERLLRLQRKVSKLEEKERTYRKQFDRWKMKNEKEEEEEMNDHWFKEEENDRLRMKEIPKSIKRVQQEVDSSERKGTCRKNENHTLPFTMSSSSEHIRRHDEEKKRMKSNRFESNIYSNTPPTSPKNFHQEIGSRHVRSVPTKRRKRVHEEEENTRTKTIPRRRRRRQSSPSNTESSIRARNRLKLKKKRKKFDVSEASSPEIIKPQGRSRSSLEKPFRHKETVRGRDAREQLNGYECIHCANFFEAMEAGGVENVAGLCNGCSRHRAAFTPEQTPAGFWCIEFPDSETQGGVAV